MHSSKLVLRVETSDHLKLKLEPLSRESSCGVLISISGFFSIIAWQLEAIHFEHQCYPIVRYPVVRTVSIAFLLHDE